MDKVQGGRKEGRGRRGRKLEGRKGEFFALKKGILSSMIISPWIKFITIKARSAA